MKKITITISEFELNDDLDPIAVKRFATSSLFEENDEDEFVPYICDTKSNEIKEFFLKERKNIPFRKIRSSHE